MIDLSREKELVGQIKAKTMPKTMEISLQESKALKRIMNGTLSDWDRQHNNWAVEYLKTKNKYEYIRNNMIKKQLGIDVFNKLFENYEKNFYQYVKK